MRPRILIMRTVLRSLATVWVASLAIACSSAKTSPSPMPAMSAPSVVPPDADGLVCKKEQRAVAPISLLTRAQYDATIADLRGDNSQPSQTFPAENEVSGYNN